MSNELEQEILLKGLTTGPRTTNQEVEALLATVRYDVHHIPGTATITATAILPMGKEQWTLATAYSSAASSANFNLELGTTRALEKAKAAAKEELWKLESYVLAKSVASDSAILVQLSEEDITVLKADDVWLRVKSEIDKTSGLPKLAMDVHHIVSKVLAHLGKPDFVEGPIPIKIPRKHIVGMVSDEKFQDMVDVLEESMLESTIRRIFVAVASALKAAVA